MKSVVVLCLLALALAADPQPAAAANTPPPKPVADVLEMKLASSKELMRYLQGINETTVWIVQFHDNDPEANFVQTIKDELANNDALKDVTYQKLHYRVAIVDVNNKQFEDAMNQLGMTSNQFQATYPVALVMRKRKGLFAWGFDLGKAVSERLTDVADGKTDPFE